MLLAPDTMIERVAIPWLHVIREHPVFLANYADLFEREKNIKAIGRHWLRILRNKVLWFRQIVRALLSDGEPWFGPKELPEQVDVLFVSHLLNTSHAGQAEDFYFGGLPNELVTQGHSVVIALINHSGQPCATLAGMWKKNTVPRVILSGSLEIPEEIAFHQRLKKESVRLKKSAQKETSGLFRKVLVRASQEARSGGPQSALRMAKQIGALVATLKPKTIILTHEGHAWERVTFAAARNVIPDVQCIGYQHAALFRFQHAIRRNLSSKYNPDQILTAGIVGKAQLERVTGLNGIPISVLGSNRTSKGATINGESPMHTGQAEHSDNSKCLVLPEGIASECNILFEFSMACAQACPEIQFIWRLHPLVTYESLAAQNPRLRNHPSNIVLSEATLEEDIACCRWTLYRGTTAVVQAVVAGLRPIYLQLLHEMSIDPLYEINEWRVKVTTVSEFRDVMNVDANIRPCVSEVENAKKYCEDFFVPFDAKALFSSIGN